MPDKSWQDEPASLSLSSARSYSSLLSLVSLYWQRTHGEPNEPAGWLVPPRSQPGGVLCNGGQFTLPYGLSDVSGEHFTSWPKNHEGRQALHVVLVGQTCALEEFREGYGWPEHSGQVLIERRLVPVARDKDDAGVTPVPLPHALVDP